MAMMKGEWGRCECGREMTGFMTLWCPVCDDRKDESNEGKIVIDVWFAVPKISTWFSSLATDDNGIVISSHKILDIKNSMAKTESNAWYDNADLISYMRSNCEGSYWLCNVYGTTKKERLTEISDTITLKGCTIIVQSWHS